jgi:hypothetical protein
MNTYTTISTGARRSRLIALVVGICILAIPSSASAFYGPASGNDQAPDGVPSNAGLVTPDHTALNESLAPATGSNGGRVVDTPAATPIQSAPASADAFDWADAALGAGAVMALVAISGTALLTLRRRTVSPSASTS